MKPGSPLWIAIKSGAGGKLSYVFVAPIYGVNDCAASRIACIS